MARFTRVFGVRKLPVQKMRGLRMRLTLSFVLFFSVLMVAIGLFYRKTLEYDMEADMRAALEEEWGAAKGYLRIENQQPIWATSIWSRTRTARFWKSRIPTNRSAWIRARRSVAS